MDDNGQPTIYSTGCSTEIDHVDVHFHGGLAIIYNLFRGHVGDWAKRRIKDIVCSKHVTKETITHQ